MRRSVTLADQLAAVGPAGSCNLRDLLKLRDEDDLDAGRRAAVTLASAMAAEKRSSSPSPSTSAAAEARTLLDIIRDDQPPTSSAAAAAAGANAGAGDPLVCRAVSLPAPRATSPPALTATEVAPPPPQAPQSQVPTDEEQGERVSLMALLEQTERQWSAGAGATVRDQELAAAQALGAEYEAEPEVGKGAAGGGCCCVCMARAKGAAFIPCGHTFCRTCARELLAGRGLCPLCNAAIVDVLDIF